MSDDIEETGKHAQPPPAPALNAVVDPTKGKVPTGALTWANRFRKEGWEVTALYSRVYRFKGGQVQAFVLKHSFVLGARPAGTLPWMVSACWEAEVVDTDAVAVKPSATGKRTVFVNDYAKRYELLNHYLFGFRTQEAKSMKNDIASLIVLAKRGASDAE